MCRCYWDSCEQWDGRRGIQPWEDGLKGGHRWRRGSRKRVRWQLLVSLLGGIPLWYGHIGQTASCLALFLMLRERSKASPLWHCGRWEARRKYEYTTVFCGEATHAHLFISVLSPCQDMSCHTWPDASSASKQSLTFHAYVSKSGLYSYHRNKWVAHYCIPWKIHSFLHEVADSMAHRAVALKEEGNKWGSSTCTHSTVLHWLDPGISKIASTQKRRVSILKRTAHQHTLLSHIRPLIHMQNTKRPIKPQALHQPRHDPHQASRFRRVHGWLPQVDRAGPCKYEGILPPRPSPTRPESPQRSPHLRPHRLRKVPRD